VRVEDKINAETTRLTRKRAVQSVSTQPEWGKTVVCPNVQI